MDPAREEKGRPRGPAVFQSGGQFCGEAFMNIIRVLLAAAALSGLAACTQSEPDNAMTRYAQNLADDQRKAQMVADKANRVIAQEQRMGNEAANQGANQ